MQNYEDLTVWKRSHALLLQTYKASGCFPRYERFGLTAQLRRSALSIGSNLAEGCGRVSRADYRRFVGYASGSAKELQYQLLVARDLGYLDATLHAEISDNLDQIQRMLRALYNRLSPKT